MTAATQAELQELFIAYFGRPAAQAGLNHYLGTEITQEAFAAEMHAQPEFQDAFGSLSVENQVNQIFNNLFNRDAAPEGLLYWTQEINSGSLELASIAVNLIFSAQNEEGEAYEADALVLSNRVAAAEAFTEQVSSTSEGITNYTPVSTDPFEGGENFQEAKDFIATVTGEAPHTEEALDAVVATIEATDSQEETARTFQLTTGIDSIIGTTGDDVVENALQNGGDTETMQGFDTIDLGEGNDTMNIINTENAEYNSPNISGVENITYRASDNAGDLDVSTFDGDLENLTIDSSSNGVDVNNLTTDIDFSIVDARASFNSTITYNADNVDNDDDAGNVTFDGVADGAEIDFAGAIESLTINTEGDSSRMDNFVVGATVDTITIAAEADLRVDDILTAAGLETLNISGAGGVRLDPALANTVETIAAGDSTGDIRLTVGTEDMTITTGGGDDLIDFQGNLDNDDEVALGEGEDTLQIDLDGLAAGGPDLEITGGDIFKFDNTAGNNGAIQMDNIELTSITIDGAVGAGQAATAGVLTFTDLATDVTTFNLIAEGDRNDNFAFNGFTADYDVSGTDNVENVTVNIGNDGTTGDDAFVNDITIDDLEGILIEASDIGDEDDDELTISLIDGDALEAITVNADGEVIITDINAAELEDLDLSGITGGVEVADISAYSADLTITGTEENDDIAPQENTGTNEITVDLGSGNDAYTSVDDEDTITTGAGSDTITFQGDGADDANTITDFSVGTGGDIIDFVTNGANDGSAALTNLELIGDADDIAEAGIVVIDNSAAGVADADSLTAANIADRVNDIGDDNNGGGADSILSQEAAEDDFYLVISDGTDTAIALVETVAGNTVIAAAEITVIATLEDVDDASEVTVANFADFI